MTRDVLIMLSGPLGMFILGLATLYFASSPRAK